MVLEVIPAAHGKATSFVTDAMNVHVSELNRDGGHVVYVCSDGDSTYVQKLGQSYELLADPDAYDMRLHLHRQEEVMQRIQIPGTNAGHCFDIDHQGKWMRYLSVDGRWLTVFPRYSDAYYSFDVNVGVLRDLGMPAACLRRDAAGKMDDVLAAKLYSGPNLIRIGEPCSNCALLSNSWIIFPSALLSLKRTLPPIAPSWESAIKAFVCARLRTGSMCLGFAPIRLCTGIYRRPIVCWQPPILFAQCCGWFRCASSWIPSSDPRSARAK
jgi:hypothetical protein